MFYRCGGVDSDGDVVTDDCDNCPDIINANQNDADDDGIGDVCDDCTDTDGDGFGDPGFAANTCPVDNCPTFANPSQEDSDLDGWGDACCCVGIRGNLDDKLNDAITVSGLVFMVDFIFTRGAAPYCPNEANVNGDAGGDIDISDLVALADYIFTGSPQPAVCP